MQNLLAPYCDASHGAVFAHNIAQEKELWRLRETITEAEQRETGSIKHDISVPPAAMAAFLERARPIVHAIMPQARIIAFGHIGDGNLHYNLQRPPDMDEETFQQFQPRFAKAVYDLAVQMGGSISAEHGIGQLRLAELKRYKGSVDVDVMRRIKAALDPKGILNPAKVID